MSDPKASVCIFLHSGPHPRGLQGQADTEEAAELEVTLASCQWRKRYKDHPYFATGSSLNFLLHRYVLNI